MIISRLFRALYRWLKLRISPPPSLADTSALRIEAADRDHALQLAAFDRELAMSLPPDNRFARMPANDYWRLSQQSRASQYNAMLATHASQYNAALVSAALGNAAQQYGNAGSQGQAGSLLASILGQ